MRSLLIQSIVAGCAHMTGLYRVTKAVTRGQGGTSQQ